MDTIEFIKKITGHDEITILQLMDDYGYKHESAEHIGDVDMTVEEFYSGFNLDFMTEEEKQTIYTATELYAKGKLRQCPTVL